MWRKLVFWTFALSLGIWRTTLAIFMVAVFVVLRVIQDPRMGASLTVFHDKVYVAYLWFYSQEHIYGQPFEGHYRQFYVSQDSCASTSCESTSSLEEEQPRAVFKVAIREYHHHNCWLYCINVNCSPPKTYFIIIWCINISINIIFLWYLDSKWA